MATPLNARFFVLDNEARLLEEIVAASQCGKEFGSVQLVPNSFSGLPAPVHGRDR